jgi:uncharacterized protein
MPMSVNTGIPVRRCQTWPELIRFVATHRQDKISLASDHPVPSFERRLAEAQELPLRDGVLEKYLRGNALSVFD